MSSPCVPYIDGIGTEGPEDDQLFVTTAHCGAVGGDASRQALYPDSGHVFKVDLNGRFKGGRWRFDFAG